MAPLNESDNSFINMATDLDGTQTLHHFAFDWIHNLIYHIYNYEVLVANINNLEISKRILETDLSISSFNVHPNESLLFWSEYSGIYNETHSHANSRIMRSNQDGSNKKILRFKGLGLVFELSIDFTSNLLFWFDFQLNVLSSMDFSGNNFRVILKLVDMTFIDSTAGFDLFNNYIYYCCGELNKTSKAICKIDVNNGNISEIFHLYDREMKIRPDFRFIHESRQPDSDDRCLNSNCSHLCLPLNVTHYRCVCPTSKQIESCIESVSNITHYFNTKPV